MQRYVRRILLSLVVVGLLTPSWRLWATPIFTPHANQTCQPLNCNAVRIDGIVSKHLSHEARPWIIEVFMTAGQCLRADVIAQPPLADLEMVVVSPDGTVYRNDDGGTCPNCPLVKLAQTPRTGFYTIQLSHYNGDPVTNIFTLMYGAYNAGNPNCANPTPPLFTDELEVEKVEEVAS